MAGSGGAHSPGEERKAAGEDRAASAKPPRSRAGDSAALIGMVVAAFIIISTFMVIVAHDREAGGVGHSGDIIPQPPAAPMAPWR